MNLYEDMKKGSCITFTNFISIFNDDKIFHAMGVSLARTVLGTVITVVCTSFMAFLFSQVKLPHKRFFNRFVVITMYFSSGLIPWYLTMTAYGLKNSFLLYIIPSAVNAYYMILIKAYLESLPPSLQESAEIDGAGIITVFFKIVMPLSKPILAAVALFSAVGQWNTWSDNLYLVKNPKPVHFRPHKKRQYTALRALLSGTSLHLLDFNVWRSTIFSNQITLTNIFGRPCGKFTDAI